MANIDDGFRVEILSLDDKTLLASGINQPNLAPGYEAPQGSLYLRRSSGSFGDLYVKKGPADLDWFPCLGTKGNITYTMNTEPTGVNDGDGWYNIDTTLLQIYNNGAFQPVKVNEAIEINDGYF